MCSAIFHSVQQGKAKSQPPVNLVLHLKPEGALYSVYLILLFENAVSVGHRLSVREMARITRTFNIANGRKNESSDGYHIYIYLQGGHTKIMLLTHSRVRLTSHQERLAVTMHSLTVIACTIS